MKKFTIVWPKIPKTKEEWRNFRFVYLETENYECWFNKSETICVERKNGFFEIPYAWSMSEESETVEKSIYQVKHVDQFRYFTIIRWFRHPNHWE